MEKRNESLRRIYNGLDQFLGTKFSDLVRMVEKKYRNKIEIVLDDEEQNALKTFKTLPKVKDWYLYFDGNFDAVLVAKDEDFYVSCTTEFEENRKMFITNLERPKAYCSIAENEKDDQTFILYRKDDPSKTLSFSTTPKNSEVFRYEENLKQQEQMTRGEIHIIFTERYDGLINRMCGYEKRYYWRLYFQEQSCSLICVGTDYKREIEKKRLDPFIKECINRVAASKFVVFCGIEEIGKQYRVFIEDKYRVGFSI